MSYGVACAHSIVAHRTISAATPGTVTDAWACCDCGARFSRDTNLPVFMPEASHLHLKLATANERVKELKALAQRWHEHEESTRIHAEFSNLTEDEWFEAAKEFDATIRAAIAGETT